VKRLKVVLQLLGLSIKDFNLFSNGGMKVHRVLKKLPSLGFSGVVFGRQYSTYDTELAVLVEVFVHFRKEGSAILNLIIF